MVDVLPTFDETPPVAASHGEGSEASEGSEGEAGTTSAQGSLPGEPASDQASAQGASQGASEGTSEGAPQRSSQEASQGSSQGTRAEGGLEPTFGGEGELTRAEQVAILDRQLEQSTSEFDGLILSEQARQRAAARERAAASTTSATSALEGDQGAGSSRNPYRDDVAMGGGTGRGPMASNGTRTPPQNPAIYSPPEDIPEGNDDDVVARQLREAAMREPDPQIRERLWNEYRRYKGIEIPEE
jgi:hypothetical protein